ncbi:MAG: ATP-dependent helicase, partial [Pseudonocardia sp.]|nr:ATP-dependent helicase [Pseudonocardia sp.]
MSVLARAVGDVEAALRNGRLTAATRTRFQAVALLLREERARVQADEAGSDAHRGEQLKRLDGIARTLAMTAVREPALLALLAEDAVVSDEARAAKRDVLRAAGLDTGPETDGAAPVEPPAAAKPRVVPQSVVSRQLANPFLAPDFSAARPSAPRPTP